MKKIVFIISCLCLSVISFATDFNRFKRISVKDLSYSVNKTKQFYCFDTNIKNYGEKAGVSYIGIADDSMCVPFAKKYKISTYQTFSNPLYLACYESDLKDRHHNKVIRVINHENKITAPCNEKLFYKPRRISKKCFGNNCKRYQCYYDVLDEQGNILLTRERRSNDVIQKSCAKFSKAFLLTKSGSCYEFDMDTSGELHFIESNGCRSSEADIYGTEYILTYSSENLLSYLTSFFVEKSCFEVDTSGGNIYKEQVENSLCTNSRISNRGRSYLKNIEEQPINNSDKKRRNHRSRVFKE